MSKLYSSNKIECPYCKKLQEINHDDGYGYQEGEIHNQECSGCGKSFVYETDIVFHYWVDKADCLQDDSLHEYFQTTRDLNVFSLMRCRICGNLRKPLKEEEYLFTNKETD